MDTKIKEPKEWCREIEFEIEPETVKNRREKVAQVYQKKAEISGFRKGMAPRELVEKRFGDSIQADTVDFIIQDAYQEAVEKHGFKPITRGEASEVKVGDDQKLAFRISFEVLPNFNLGDYKGIRVKPKSLSNEDEALAMKLAGLQERLAVYSPVDRTAQINDFVLVDYTVFEGKKVFQKDAGVLVRLGDDLNYKEINDGLVGVKKDDERTIEIEFRPDHSDPSLAGKKLAYRFAVRDVKERHLPPVDDDFARTLNVENLGALEEKLKQELAVEKTRLVEQDLVKQIYQQLVERHRFEPPPSLVAAAYYALLEENRLEDSEENRKKLLPVAGGRVKLDLILDRIIDREGLRSTPEEIQRRIEDYARQLNTDPVRLKDSFYRLRRMEGLANRVSREKASEWLLNHARRDGR